MKTRSATLRRARKVLALLLSSFLFCCFLSPVLFLSCLSAAHARESISGITQIAAGEVRALGSDSGAGLLALLRQAKLMPSLSGPAAVLGIMGPVQLEMGAIIGVDTSPITYGNELYLGPNSLLVVPAEQATDPLGLVTSPNHAYGSPTHVFFAEGARLYLANAKVGQDYKIFADNMAVSMDDFGRLDLNKIIIADSPLLVPMASGTSVMPNRLGFRVGFVDEIYPRTSPAQQLYVTEALEKDRIGPAHVNSASGGVRLLSRAIDRRYLGTDANAVARTLQSAQDMVQAAGVAAMAWQAHQNMLDAMDVRSSFRTADPPAMQPFAPAPYLPLPDASLPKTDGQHVPHSSDLFPGNSSGQSAGDSAAPASPGPNYTMSDSSMTGRPASPFALWVRPMYSQWHSSDVGSLNPHFSHELDASVGGLVLGADYTLPGLLRAGVSLGLGKGHARGGGDYSDTDNDMRFGAVGAYTALCLDNWLLAAEGAYTDAWHSLEQELDPRLGMASLEANMHTRTYGYKLRQEWRKQFDWLTFTEHMSLGEHWVDTDAYTIKSGGQAVVRGKALQQQIGVFSCGLAVEHVFHLDTDTLGQFWLKPVLDYEITQAHGDIESMHHIGLAGMAGMDQKAYSLVTATEQLSSTVRASLYAGNDVWQFGISYAHEAGRHRQGNSLTGSLVWHF